MVPGCTFKRERAQDGGDPGEDRFGPSLICTSSTSLLTPFPAGRGADYSEEENRARGVLQLPLPARESSLEMSMRSERRQAGAQAKSSLKVSHGGGNGVEERRGSLLHTLLTIAYAC